ncbi:MAG TPA: ribosome-associated translation inhibitor RaiA [Candidatus Moranbacteria bacterium]|nr:ribosome-associated translation inhibitor RaiA [Candidatus Moranbacteria bacterium]
MNVDFVFNGLEISEADRAYAAEKISATAKLFGGLERAVATVRQTPQKECRLEVTLESPAGGFRAAETAVDIRAAADLVEDALKEQLRDFKDRRRTLERRGARSIKKKLTLDGNSRL